MAPHAYYTYLEMNGDRFFTAVLLPEKEGRFPTVIYRSPYVADAVDTDEDQLLQGYLHSFRRWLARGYAFIYQHCKGQGKSTGAFVPYVHEREDGLALREWIRTRPFYNGELFLVGGSYETSLHYATAPFESDVKGAVFEVQDSERYRLWYRNGQMRKGHANWHFDLYKRNCGLDKQFSMRSFSDLPLASLSERVLGDRAEDFEQMLSAQAISDPFWSTRAGGCDTRGAIDHANIPILLTTGYHDYYIGGVFQMWRDMDEATKRQSALLISPYNHGDEYDNDVGLSHENGKRREQFGRTYTIDWLDHVRNNTPLPYRPGVITYYRAFESGWAGDFEATPTKDVNVPLGSGERTLRYDPLNPIAFSTEGMLDATPIDGRTDVISLTLPPLQRDVFIKGRMRASVTVSSNCEDTSFYLRISIKRGGSVYPMRHDITSLCYQLGDYTPGEEVTLSFCFDEYAFLLRTEDSLQVDITAADDNTYVCHTNKKGAYAEQTEAVVATNRVNLDKSYLILPIE